MSTYHINIPIHVYHRRISLCLEQRSSIASLSITYLVKVRINFLFSVSTANRIYFSLRSNNTLGVFRKLPLVIENSFLVKLFSDCDLLDNIRNGIEGQFIGIWDAVMKNGFGLVKIFLKVIWPIDDWSILNRKSNSSQLVWSDVVITAGCLSEIVLVVVGSY